MAKTSDIDGADDTADDTAGGTPSSAVGFLAYWAPPVLVGLLVGLGIVALVRHGGIGRSEVDEIVDRWDYYAAEENAALGEQIAALGSSAREDLIDAFNEVAAEHMEMKVWVGRLLLSEPFFDTRSLARIARDASGAERRAAAAALSIHLQEEADPEVVMPGLLEWLGDLTRDDQAVAIRALGALGPLTSDWRTRARDVLLPLATKRPPLSDDPEMDFVPEVRADAIAGGLAALLPDPDIEDLLHATIADDEDDYAPRVAAVRALSENGRITEPEPWRAASLSSDHVVRQAVAENLFRASGPEYGEILAPMHVDAHPFVRMGSVESQMERGEATMLDVMDQLLEDHDQWVRFWSMNACAAFRDRPGAPARSGQLLRLLAESDESSDVEGALLALHTITKRAYGVREADLQHYMHQVDETALDSLMKDPEARATAVEKYREAFGGTAVWTTEDRRATLTELLSHADPDNRARAERLLAELDGE